MRRTWLSVAALVLVMPVSHTAHAQSDTTVERAVRSAGLVVEAEAARFLRPSSRAEVKVIENLKGTAPADRINVDFERAPFGLWPKLGERKILCLAQKGLESYELAAHSGAVLAPEDDLRFVVRKAAAPVVAVPVGLPTEGTATAAVVEPEKKASTVLATRAGMAETVLVGALSNVKDASGGAVGTFAVEKSLIGYGAYPEPVTVQFPPASGKPEAGRYALFLKSRPLDGGFSVVSGTWGIVPLGDEQADSNLEKDFAEVDAKKDRLTSIQAAIVEWQDAWNKRDLARVMKCYSSENRLRRQYGTSAEARARLKEQLDTFPGKIELSVQKIERGRAIVPGAAGGAEVTVLLSIAVPGREEDRRTATMKFVNEDGDWRILEEGF